jgi:hypothetical protein
MGTALVDSSSNGRVIEIAEILAAGLMRLRARKSSEKAADHGESSLDCAAYQSGHAKTFSSRGGLD